ncbi:MAG: hotdog fold thioesterase [Deltaproteobacteria bacterium]|nr:hotdog fold thioesterase [Deltaproteobacteria bacterium]
MNIKNLTFTNTIIDYLGIEVRQATCDLVIMTMPVGPKVHQPFGILHGGASVVLAESAASLGTWLNIDQQRQTAVGIEINANHLHPMQSGLLIATATPLYCGQKNMVWDIKLHDESNKLICVSRCTVAIITKK